MPKINDIIEWEEFGCTYQLYIRHYYNEGGKLCISMIFEDTTHDKTTEINIPHHKVKQFLHTINRDLLSRKYEINV